MKNRISQYWYSDDPDEQDSFTEEYADVCDAAWKGMTNGDFDIGWSDLGQFHFKLTEQGRRNFGNKEN